MACSFSSLAGAQNAPVLVVPIGLEEGAAELHAFTQAAAERLGTALSERRTVDGRQWAERLNACTDAPCRGALIAEAGAIAALLIHAIPATREGRTRRPARVRLELLSTSSGDPLAAALEVNLEGEGPLVDRALGEATARRLAAAVPAPPAEALLLVTSNVSGAEIAIDGNTVAQSPASALTVAPGDYTISVRANGFLPYNRRITVTAAGARVNALLSPSAEGAATFAAQDAATEYDSVAAEPITDKWWFWAAVGGGAAVLIGVITAIAVTASGGNDGPAAIPVPPIGGSR